MMQVTSNELFPETPKGFLIALRYFIYMWYLLWYLFVLKAVNYFRKTLHLRCLRGLWNASGNEPQFKNLRTDE